MMGLLTVSLTLTFVSLTVGGVNLTGRVGARKYRAMTGTSTYATSIAADRPRVTHPLIDGCSPQGPARTVARTRMAVLLSMMCCG
jgi:hypothetical protein